MGNGMSKAKADLLLHPVRIRIMTEFSGRERTSQQLAEALPDIPQATLYRHIKVLVEGGVLEVAEEKRVNGAVERSYRVAQGGNRLTAEDMRAMSADDHIRYFTIYAASLIDTFSDYIQAAELWHVLDDGLAYNRAVVHLSDAERAQFDAEFEALVGRMLACQPAPERKRFTLASMVIPDGKPHPP
jgi:DNA-binding transcriptional ArsR family regulator